MGNYNLTAITLTKATNSKILQDDHREVVNFWAESNDMSQKCIDMVAGRHHTAEELEAYKQKKKSPITLNFFKPQERAILGDFIGTSADVKWIPWGGRGDDELAAAMEALRIWDSKRQGDDMLDMNTYGVGWCAKRAYQEVLMNYEPGFRPEMQTKDVSLFQVYPMPGSRDLIWRRDAWFYDVDSYRSGEDILTAFPEKAEYIKEKLAMRGAGRDETTGYDRIVVSRDRDHETKDFRNGTYRVIERYYRVNRDHLAFEDRGPSVSQYTGAPLCDEGVKHREELWYAVCIPDFGDEFLFNGRYHCQSIDPRNGRVIWPIVEFVWEGLNGEPQSAVEFQIDPAKATDALMANILHSAKHAASNSKLMDPTAFESEKEAKNFAMFHADSDRVFRVKGTRLTDATKTLEHSQSSNDVYKGLEMSKTAYDEIGSAPPAIQGVKQGSESGILFQSRVEQSQGQLARSKKMYRTFLEMKYLLRYVLQRQYYTWEMTIPILEPTDKQRNEGIESVTVNQQVPAVDAYGYEIPGRTAVKNGLTDILFDITVADSTRSTSYRMKTQAQLAEISNNPAAASNPQLAAIVLEAQFEMSDIDPRYKDKLIQVRKDMQESEQQAAAANQAVAQAATMKGQAAMTMAQSQVANIDSQTNSLQVKAMVDQKRVELDERKVVVQEQTAGAQIRKTGSDIQTSQAGVALQAQSQQEAARGKDIDLMLKQVELSMKQEEMNFKREEWAYNIKMKELELKLAEERQFEQQFAPVK